MKRLTRPIAAALLIATGVVGDHVLSAQMNQDAGAATSAVSVNTKTLASQASTTNSAAPAAADATTERAFAIASASVVYVENVGVGSGSGVIYDSNGDIVTNAHVVAGSQGLKVTLASGKTYSARILGTDTADDIAVIHVNATGLPAAKFAAAGDFQVAQTVLAIGSPLGLQQTVTSGLISALNRTVQEANGAYLPDALQTSAPINPGNSGGALVTLEGSVVGIPTLEASDPQNNNGGAAQGIGFAIPSTRVTYVVKQIISTGKVQHTGRAYLGLAAVDSSQVNAGQGGGYGQGGFGIPGYGQGGAGQTPTVAGAVVQNVASGSPAAQAGIQVGDVITAINGASVGGEDDLLTALAHQKPGATISITLNRNGSNVTVHAHLGELAAAQ